MYPRRVARMILPTWTGTSVSNFFSGSSGLAGLNQTSQASPATTARKMRARIPVRVITEKEKALDREILDKKMGDETGSFPNPWGPLFRSVCFSFFCLQFFCLL